MLGAPFPSSLLWTCSDTRHNPPCQAMTGLQNQTQLSGNRQHAKTVSLWELPRCQLQLLFVCLKPRIDPPLLLQQKSAAAVTASLMYFRANSNLCGNGNEPACCANKACTVETCCAANEQCPHHSFYFFIIFFLQEALVFQFCSHRGDCCSTKYSTSTMTDEDLTDFSSRGPVGPAAVRRGGAA